MNIKNYYWLFKLKIRLYYENCKPSNINWFFSTNYEQSYF